MRLEKSENKVAAAHILEVSVDALNMTLAVERVAEELKERRKGYICMVGVHGIMEAHRDKGLVPIFEEALMTVPDGQPTVWLGHWQGYRQMKQVTGPDLMLEIFSRKELSGYKHFFYGGEPGVAERLRDRLMKQFPWAKVVGTFTPPFRELNAEEETCLIERVGKVKPDIIWVGISTPKQEKFMSKYLWELDTTLMFGVGAAFDFHTGRIQYAPQWVKNIGMQWLHRLLQDPKRLWKRYMRNNSAFLWHVMLQVCGLRSYRESSRPGAYSPQKASVSSRRMAAGR